MYYRTTDYRTTYYLLPHYHTIFAPLFGTDLHQEIGLKGNPVKTRSYPRSCKFGKATITAPLGPPGKAIVATNEPEDLPRSVILFLRSVRSVEAGTMTFGAAHWGAAAGAE